MAGILRRKAQQRGFRSLFVPASDAPEAALVEGIAVYPMASLAELVQHLNGRQPIARFESQLRFDGDAAIQYPVEFQDAKGQEYAKPALEVACAGGHNCLLKGPPGAGKTLLAPGGPLSRRK